MLELCSHMAMWDTAHHLGISWHTVKDIQKRYLQRRFFCRSLKGLKRIAIDEISIGHGHRYLTVALDLHSAAVVFVGEGKGVNALSPFWKRLKSSRAGIEAVAMDMSQAYIAAVTSNLPRETIVFDHFHVIKLMNEKLTELRRDLYRDATDLLRKNVFKGTRWLLLKNPEHLRDDRNERLGLQEALSLNKPLAVVYYMKEDLRLLWSLPNKATADVDRPRYPRRFSPLPGRTTYYTAHLMCDTPFKGRSPPRQSDNMLARRLTPNSESKTSGTAPLGGDRGPD